MIKSRTIKVKSIENEEQIMTITIIKIIITTTIVMIMRIKIGNRIKI